MSCQEHDVRTKEKAPVAKDNIVVRAILVMSVELARKLMEFGSEFRVSEFVKILSQELANKPWRQYINEEVQEAKHVYRHIH